MTAHGSCASDADVARAVDVPGNATDGALRAPVVEQRASRGLALEREEWLALARERVADGADLWIRVRGASMAPSLPAGTLVRLSPLRGSAPRVSDVVLALLPSGLPVLHRIVAVAGHGISLQGDALPRPDPVVQPGAVLARATAIRDGAVVREVPGAPRWRRLRWWRGVLARWWRARSTGH